MTSGPDDLLRRPVAVRWVQRLERARGLDGAVAALRPVARSVAGGGARERVLRGSWMGHALHPVAVVAPLGLFGSACAVDAIGGPGVGRIARRLTLLGLVSTLPAVATGLVEWSTTAPREARVGVVHAAANALATTTLLGSWWARSRGGPLGPVLGAAGLLIAGAGGHLGGHLATARRVGSRDPAFADAASAQPAGPTGNGSRSDRTG